MKTTLPGQRRFLCDVMLQGLTRWLRAAGHDTHQATVAQSDRDLVEQARHGQRILLTRDRKLLEIRHAREHACLLQANALPDWVCQLNREWCLDWLHAPFSRCLCCNTELTTASAADWERVPETSRRFLRELRLCPRCGQVFWAGSHVARMRRRLQEWQDLCRE